MTIRGMTPPLSPSDAWGAALIQAKTNTNPPGAAGAVLSWPRASERVEPTSMGALTDLIAIPERKKAVVHDAAVLLDEEVASKGGVSGLAVKAAFGMVKAVKPGIIPETIDGLLPEFAAVLDPIFAQRPEGTALGGYLMSREKDVVQALLSVTDARAKRTTHKTLSGAYNRLRPSAEKQVAAAMPRVAKLMDKHVGSPAVAAASAGGPAT
jgi:hypothetical protein